jgi:protein-tyrosine phosphatase
MYAHTWWINESSLVMAASNPTDEDLAQLRAMGFSVVVTFLEEEKQPPKYDKRSAVAIGWNFCSFPIEEGGAPSIKQLSEFVKCMKLLPQGTRVLMHCESGLGRTACMVAAYWIASGMTAEQAMNHVRRTTVGRLHNEKVSCGNSLSFKKPLQKANNESFVPA